MKPTAFLKKMDNDRYIQIPKFVNDVLGLSAEDLFEVFIDEENSSIIFKKVQDKEIYYRK